MRNFENLDVFEMLITQKQLKCPIGAHMFSSSNPFTQLILVILVYKMDPIVYSVGKTSGLNVSWSTSE